MWNNIFIKSFFILIFFLNQGLLALPREKTFEQKWLSLNDGASKIKSHELTVFLTELENWRRQVLELKDKSLRDCQVMNQKSEQISCFEKLELQYKSTLKSYFSIRQKFYDDLQKFYQSQQEKAEASALSMPLISK